MRHIVTSALLILCTVSVVYYIVENVVCSPAERIVQMCVCVSMCLHNLAALPALCVLNRGVVTLACKPLHICLGNKFCLSSYVGLLIKVCRHS